MTLDDAFAQVPDGCDFQMEVELVFGGWVLYVWIRPGAGPVSVARHRSSYTRSETMPTFMDAVRQLPEVIRRAVAEQVTQ